MKKLSQTAAFIGKNFKIVGADPATIEGWTGIPNFVLKNKKIKPGSKVVYGVLLDFARGKAKAFPGQERIANEAGCSPRSVRSYLNQLKTADLLDWEQRGQGKTNLYTLYVRPPFWRSAR